MAFRGRLRRNEANRFDTKIQQMSKINKTPNFLKMAEQLKKDIQGDAEEWGMDFIHGNFDKQGFTDEAFIPWKSRAIPSPGNILQMSGDLLRSISVGSSSTEQVEFVSDSPYAEIHNEGGTIRLVITDKMRKFFWAMWYETQDSRWKAMALTKESSFIISIPQRKFMGDSVKFLRVWDKHVAREIEMRFKNLKH